MKCTRTQCASDRPTRAPAPKLGPVNDLYERQAEQAATQITRGERVSGDAFGAASATVQASTAQTRNAAHNAAAPAAAAAVSKGGRGLSAGERSFFEPRFGRDLGHVRLHTDSAASQAAYDIGARAYTYGSHMAFAAGQYDPHTRQGRHLMAHELAHTLQSTTPDQTIRRAPDGFGMDDEFGMDEDNLGMPRDPFGRRPGRDHDPRGPGRHSTLSYRHSQELSRCISQMGDNPWGRANCANIVLGTPMPENLSVPGISTPVPSASAPRTDGGAVMRVGQVTLSILPDVRSTDPAMQNRAETAVTSVAIPAGTNQFSWQSTGGRITSFTVRPETYQLQIQTTYGPGVSASSPSGYGRGTTAQDQATGTTSLGFHEGRHGQDFINYLRNNPFPRFRGRTGPSVSPFTTRVNQFTAALQTYVQQMSRASELATDCTGTTIDQFNAANGTATTVCVAQPGDPTP